TNAPGASVASQTVGQLMTLAHTTGAGQTQSLQLRLKPQELGQIEIQLTRDAQGRVSAHLTADRESTHVALSQSLGQLRETLTQAGITVDRLQVRTQGGLLSGNGTQADGRRNSQRSQTTGTNFLTNNTEAGGVPHADEEKLLSIRA